METPDLQKLMAEMMTVHNALMAAHRETEHHVVRMMERQADPEAMAGRIEALAKSVAENNIRLSLEIHDYNIDELDARLKRLEERNRGRRPQ